jgi:hypothetical protein
MRYAPGGRSIAGLAPCISGTIVGGKVGFAPCPPTRGRARTAITATTATAAAALRKRAVVLISWNLHAGNQARR